MIFLFPIGDIRLRLLLITPDVSPGLYIYIYMCVCVCECERVCVCEYRDRKKNKLFRRGFIYLFIVEF